MGSILIIERDYGVRLLLKRYLTSWGYDVDATANIEEAIKIAGDKAPSLVIMDIRACGLDNRRTIKELSPCAKFIAMSGGIDEHERDSSLELVDLLIKKPFDLMLITKLVDQVLENMLINPKEDQY